MHWQVKPERALIPDFVLWEGGVSYQLANNLKAWFETLINISIQSVVLKPGMMATIKQ